MHKKLVITLLLIALTVMVSACSLVWPTENPEAGLSDTGNDGTVSVGSQVGSFLPTVIPASGENLRLRTVYLLDYQGRYLVPYVLSVDRVEGIAKEVLARLVDTPENASALAGTEFQLPLPSGTEVIGMTVRDGLAVVDFSQDFLQFADAGRERLAVDSVLYTLTEFSTIDRVELRVQGRPIEQLPSGQPLPTSISRADRDLNLEVAPGVTDVSQGTKVRLYFSGCSPNGGLIYFVPVTRVIPTVSDPMTAAVLELIRGPLSGSDLSADVPASAELHGVRLSGTTASVDFSSGLTGYGGGTTAEQAMLGALILTLTEVPGVSNVQVTVEGQVPNLPEGSDLSQPITRPMFVNPFII